MSEPKYEAVRVKHCPICGSTETKISGGWGICSDCRTKAPIKIWQGRRVAQGEDVNRALAFEMRVRELIQEYSVTGITVVELVGVLECIKNNCFQLFNKNDDEVNDANHK